MDYALARAKDIPPVTIAKMTIPSPINSLRAKGVGESGTIRHPCSYTERSYGCILLPRDEEASNAPYLPDFMET